MNPLTLKNKSDSLFLQEKDLEKIIEKIRIIRHTLNSEKIIKLSTLQQELIVLENKSQLSLSDIAETNSIDFYKSPEFITFLKSMEAYVLLLEKENYPSEGERCVLCNQKLGNNGLDLLQNYRKILNDNTQRKITSVKNTIKEWENALQRLDIGLELSQPSFGISPNQTIIQPQILIDLHLYLENYRKALQSNTYSKQNELETLYINCLETLEDKKATIIADLATTNNNIADIERAKNTLTEQINELLDRKLLNENIDEALKVLKNYTIRAKLIGGNGKFNTASISHKTTAAREYLVKQNFSDLFEVELRLFRKSNIKVDFNFNTLKGTSRLSQTIKNQPLSHILSEGEQKVIALAAFLAELQLDNTKAPVIFDDPVNSLDHKIIDEVAKRFIELSVNRQIIVFTHSILLLNSFLQQVQLEPNKKLGIKFHSVKANFGETGIVGEVGDLNSYDYYNKKLKAVINTSQNNQDEQKLAAAGYAHLRSAIEVTVEKEIFQEVVKRYRKGIAFPSLLRVDGRVIDECKIDLNNIYEKCCVSIDAHSSPSEIHNPHYGRVKN